MADSSAGSFASRAGTPRSLAGVGVGEAVVVHEVRVNPGTVGDLGTRLLELGFVPGEPLRVVARGFPGGEPLAVRIGSTTFALRRFEADHVMVLASPTGAGAQ